LICEAPDAASLHLHDFFETSHRRRCRNQRLHQLAPSIRLFWGQMECNRHFSPTIRRGSLIQPDLVE